MHSDMRFLKGMGIGLAVGAAAAAAMAMPPKQTNKLKAKAGKAFKTVENAVENMADSMGM